MIQLTKRNAKYSYVKGRRHHVTPIGELPGVTTILGATSGYDFSEWRKNNPEESKRCLDRGLALHDAVEFYFGDGFNNPNMVTLNCLFGKLYGAILKHIDPVVNEHQVYSKLGFSGSLDCLGYYHDKLTLFDWKTSTKPKTLSQVTDYLLQVASYAYALNELDGVIVDQARVVIIPEKGDCKIFTLDQSILPAYFNAFLCRLQTYQDGYC